MSELIDKGSGAVPLMRFLCALSKNAHLQSKCKYYRPGKRMPGACFCGHLGIWEEGMQRCNSEPARQGFLNACQEDRG